jgi:hypothetical protein
MAKTISHGHRKIMATAKSNRQGPPLASIQLCRIKTAAI